MYQSTEKKIIQKKNNKKYLKIKKYIDLNNKVKSK